MSAVLRSRSWILTFVANGTVITSQHFAKRFSDIDECHVTCDAAVMYVYVHFKNPYCLTSINTFLADLKRETGLTPFEVPGYDAVVLASTQSQLTEHIGFKILFEHYQTKNQAFYSCTNGRPGIFKGLFWKIDCISRIKHVLRTRSKDLYNFFEGMEQKCYAKQEGCDAEAEFDVIKKRRTIDSTGDNENTVENDQETLKNFQQFELHVLQALGHLDTRTRHEEMLLLERDLQRRDTAVGGVYVVKSDSIAFPKIGATRAGIDQRLKELNRYVPIPFKLIFWVPSAAPFKLESEIHSHFDYFRIKEGGNTEFFKLDLKTIGTFLKATYEGVVDNHTTQQQ